MVYSDAKNAEHEAQTTWRDQKTSGDSYNSNSIKRFGRASQAIRIESFRFSREDWQRRNTIRELGAAENTFGGTITQLIVELEQELAESEARVETLRDRIQKIYSFLNQLGQPKETESSQE